MVDTNCDPQNIDYVIPPMTTIRAIKLLVGKIADAVLEGKAIRKEDDSEDLKSAEAMNADASARKLQKWLRLRWNWRMKRFSVKQHWQR